MSKGKILIAVAVLVAGGAFVVKKKMTRNAAPDLRRATVTRGDVEISIQATGVVQPQNRVEIKPPIAGRVEDILVKEGDTVKKGQVLAWMSSSERAALLDAARAKGADELRHWEDLYKAAPLVAPLTGVIIARAVEPGQTVTAQDAMLVMSNRLVVKAQVDETDIGEVKLQLPAEITLDAFPGRKVAGRVDHVAFEARTVNNVTIYEVEVAPETVEDFMRAGMTANVTFLVSRKAGVLTLPAEAVAPADKGGTVLVPGADGKPVEKPVETGISNGSETEILSGLAEGDTVLIKTLAAGERKSAGSNPFNPMSRRPSGQQRSGGSGGGSR